MGITRLNHAVLFVRDADAAADFYRRVFGFEELKRPAGMRAAFMRSPEGGNHHDLGLFEVGAGAPRPTIGIQRIVDGELALHVLEIVAAGFPEAAGNGVEPPGNE